MDVVTFMKISTWGGSEIDETRLQSGKHTQRHPLEMVPRDEWDSGIDEHAPIDKTRVAHHKLFPSMTYHAKWHRRKKA